METKTHSFGDLIAEYYLLEDQIKAVQPGLDELKQMQSLIKSRIGDLLEETGQSSGTDAETKHRATVYDEERWVVSDRAELLAACKESPFLYGFLHTDVNDRDVLTWAATDPDLAAEIPGLTKVVSRKMRMTRGKKQ